MWLGTQLYISLLHTLLLCTVRYYDIHTNTIKLGVTNMETSLKNSTEICNFSKFIYFLYTPCHCWQSTTLSHHNKDTIVIGRRPITSALERSPAGNQEAGHDMSLLYHKVGNLISQMGFCVSLCNCLGAQWTFSCWRHFVGDAIHIKKWQ